MKRRTLLGAIATGTATSLAGCSSILGGESTPNDERVDVAGNRTNPEEEFTTPDGGYLDEDANLKEEELETDLDKVLAAKQSYEIAYSLLFAANEDLASIFDELESSNPDYQYSRQQLEYARLNTQRAIKLVDYSRDLFRELEETQAVEKTTESIQNMSAYKRDVFDEVAILIDRSEQGNEKYVVETGKEIYDRWQELESNNIAWGPVDATVDIREYYIEHAENNN